MRTLVSAKYFNKTGSSLNLGFVSTLLASFSAIFFLTGAMAYAQAPAESKIAEVYTVTMKSISFDPKVLNIKTGESVEWVNRSYTEHSATADDGAAFDTGMIAPLKTSKKVLFTKAGTYNYHCTMHGKAMQGKIIVSASSKNP